MAARDSIRLDSLTLITRAKGHTTQQEGKLQRHPGSPVRSRAIWLRGRRLCESALCLLSSFCCLVPEEERGTVFPSKEMRFGLLCKDLTKVTPAGLAHSLKVSKLVQHLHTYDCREDPMDYAGENVAHKSQAMEETLLGGTSGEKRQRRRSVPGVGDFSQLSAVASGLTHPGISHINTPHQSIKTANLMAVT